MSIKVGVKTGVFSLDVEGCEGYLWGQGYRWSCGLEITREKWEGTRGFYEESFQRAHEEQHGLGRTSSSAAGSDECRR